VKGVFLRLNPATVEWDLEELRRRERRNSERTIAGVPDPGAEMHFWVMGHNLDHHPDVSGLAGDELLRGLARRACQIKELGPDGVAASEYIRRVHKFDPEDELTTRLAGFLGTGG